MTACRAEALAEAGCSRRRDSSSSQMSRISLSSTDEWRTFLLLCALVISLWPAPAVAQTVTGTLQGTVKDASGGVLPGVTVVARNVETGRPAKR